MNTWGRFGLVLVGCMALLVSLAYTGVRFADQPVTWMPVALSLCLVFLIIGFTWAYHPVFSRIGSTHIRYAMQAMVTVLSVVVMAYLGYVLFVNVWLLFGGRL